MVASQGLRHILSRLVPSSSPAWIRGRVCASRPASTVQLRQDGTTADFLFPLDVVMRFISQVMTLVPGDVIATGTPAGVSPLQAGDTVEVSVEGVGTLSNPVADAG